VGNSAEPLLQAAHGSGIEISITCCDPDARMLREARISAKKNNLPITYVLGRAEKLPFKKEQFDFVISGAAFHWFATKNAMKEVQRILKPGGAYIVFWTQNVAGKNTIIGPEIYKKYKFQGIPRGLRDPKKVRAVFMKTGFLKVKNMQVPYREKRTMEETLGLMKTNSSYAILTSAKKKSFDREMRKAYVAAFGRGPDTIVQVINVCVGARP